MEEEKQKFKASLGNTVDPVLTKTGKKGEGKKERNKKETKNKLCISRKYSCCWLVEWESSRGFLNSTGRLPQRK